MKNITKNGLPYKRKRQGRTDYRKRLSLLKAGRPRLVIRRSLKNIVIQLVQFTPDGDKVLSSTSSQTLPKSHGLKGSLKNIPTAYITGLLAGNKIKELKIREVVPDLGSRKPHTTGAIFAALKGITDAGVSISHGKELEASVFPVEERLKGEHVTKKQNYEEIINKLKK
ncbi:50S ribosomal protein L18 [Candidatus Woesearchaeota archaeon]|jgi:large subunit ribosomal protein L18|nr:50S ribosomal protein L18 [Candidatus Woesearchaeota archaeon]MBT3438867.1 50S ribosomal protein L18 [Candidatus Woesearchaeota archaeon]MBT4058127.1 50S ribosomal protein L18 [Candidatus Woesearchaeota archaeon]MBT4208956.1 50S ribosomal protein L18 [Candidatus Woesearchaeota archaeon]MBT4732451.1 50S ribosomal protein L18 [Candidatus Woesearchaeota archaeon]